jgi:hypothetical protein
VTETEWLACTDPQKMLQSLPLLQRVGRKKELYVAAICRTIEGIFPDEDRRAESVRLLESVAEGWQGKWAADRAIHLMMNLLDEEVVVYEKSEQVWMASILRCIFGPLPFRPITITPAWLSWHDGLLVSMARQMYDSRDFTDMPALADALEEAGCDNTDILGHCRSGGEHVRGCWIVDLVLGKA